jgi:hypothetical protein
MRKHEAFPSTFLTQVDLDRPQVWTIRRVKIEELPYEDDRSKPILYFMEPDAKPLILNVTNWDLIEEIYGADSESWTGKRIEVFQDGSIMFAGKKVGGVRIRKPSNTMLNTSKDE